MDDKNSCECFLVPIHKGREKQRERRESEGAKDRQDEREQYFLNLGLTGPKGFCGQRNRTMVPHL
jgi:hypothetical protein